MGYWDLITLVSFVAGLALMVWAAKEGVTGTGEYLTKPMVVFFFRWKIKQIARRTGPGRYQIHLRGSSVRFLQWGVLWLLLVWGVPCRTYITNLPGWYDNVVYFWPWALLHVDDLLTTIDRDKWKKRFQKARNRLRWKMVLPVPQPTPSGG